MPEIRHLRTFDTFDTDANTAGQQTRRARLALWSCLATREIGGFSGCKRRLPHRYAGCHERRSIASESGKIGASQAPRDTLTTRLSGYPS